MSQLAFAVVSAGAQLYAGAQQRKAYNAQAAQAKIQGRSQAIAYKQQAADILKSMNETMGTIIARAAAGGVDPLSGSALSLANYTMKEGIREYNISKDNAVLAAGMASYQADIYRQAGDTAMLSSFVSAAGTMGEGYYRQSQLGFPALDISAGAA
jgi:hypothetical protein